MDTVFAALLQRAPGEIYVPDAPAATVENIARALIGDRPIQVRVTGIRPGEKMHEIMVSDEEAPQAVRARRLLRHPPHAPRAARRRARSRAARWPRSCRSGDSVLDYAGTVELLARHRLLLDDAPALAGHGGELLR